MSEQFTLPKNRIRALPFRAKIGREAADLATKNPDIYLAMIAEKHFGLKPIAWRPGFSEAERAKFQARKREIENAKKVPNTSARSGTHLVATALRLFGLPKVSSTWAGRQ